MSLELKALVALAVALAVGALATPLDGPLGGVHRAPGPAGRLQAARAGHRLPRRGRDLAWRRGRITSGRGCREPPHGHPPGGDRDVGSRHDRRLASDSAGDPPRGPGRHRSGGLGGRRRMGDDGSGLVGAALDDRLDRPGGQRRQPPGQSRRRRGQRGGRLRPRGRGDRARNRRRGMGCGRGRRRSRCVHGLPPVQPVPARPGLPRRRRQHANRLAHRRLSNGRVEWRVVAERISGSGAASSPCPCSTRLW